MLIDPLLLTGILVGMFLLVLSVTMALVGAVLRRGNEHITQSCETHQKMLEEYSAKYEQALDRQGLAYMEIVVRQDNQIIATNTRFLNATALLMGAKDVDPKMVEKAMSAADRSVGRVIQGQRDLHSGPAPRRFGARTNRELAELVARKNDKRWLKQVTQDVEPEQQSDRGTA